MILGKDLVVYNEPEDVYGDLFIDVQKSLLFEDNKVFVDLVPKFLPIIIMNDYAEAKKTGNFELKSFIDEHFASAKTPDSLIDFGNNSDIDDAISELWDILTRNVSDDDGSIVPLPNNFIAPGGRFQEQYYWDSYFIMLGLAASGKWSMVNSMINNFVYMIDKFGFIPTANRTYYLSRSQPPFFSLMVKLLSDHAGINVMVEYLPYMVSEYDFWMESKQELSAATNNSYLRVVSMPDGSVLNRYFDSKNTPRAEAYLNDISLSAGMNNQEAAIFYKNIRAAAESGWDFSSRWFNNPNDIKTINTTNIVPVDLNCLLYRLEETIADAYQVAGKVKHAEKYHKLSNDRLNAIQKYCWNEDLGFFVDYNLEKNQQNQNMTLAAVYPLFMRIATDEQAKKVADILKKKFLKKGGLSTSLFQTNQQWDSPNGWAPLQWMAVQGLYNYGYVDLAKKIKNAWVKSNQQFFKRNGLFVEKYNVDNPKKYSKGGEYKLQNGFGWTNGVLASFLQQKR